MNENSKSQHGRGAVLWRSEIARGLVLAALFCFGPSAWGQTSSPCDLNSNGTVDQTDVSLAASMTLGTASCAANIEGPLTCTVVTVQRVFNTSQGQPCLSYSGHSVTLSWIASTSAGIAGYNVYRGTASGGPYALLSSSLVAGLTYADLNVVAGQSYFYVVTAVDVNGNESAYSAEAQGTVPSP